MFRGTLALFNQTLRKDSRKLSVHIVLMLFVSCLLLMIWQGNATGVRFGAPGLRLFQSIVFVNFWFIVLAGFSYFSSAITEEKEEGTLGLLKLTGMSPLVLLFGKSTSRIVFACLFLAVQIPFVQLAVTMGGLKSPHIWAAYLALASFMYFVANLGLFCSVVSKSSTMAAIGVFVFGLLFGVLWGLSNVILTVFLDSLGSNSESGLYSFLWWTKYFIVGEPTLFRLRDVLSRGIDETMVASHVWTSLLWGTFFFWMSWISFEKSTTELAQPKQRPIVDYRALLPRREQGENSGDKPRRLHLRKNLNRPGNHPIAWKDFHLLAGGYIAMQLKWIIYGAIVVLGIIYVLVEGRGALREDIAGVVVCVGLFFFALETTYLAGRLFRDEIRSQTWDSLVLLPKSFRELVYGKVVGCVYSLIPALVLIVVGFLIAPDTHLKELFYNTDHFLRYTLLVIQFVTFLHLVVYLSLLMLWGSLPITLFISFVVLRLSGAFIYLGSGALYAITTQLIFTIIFAVIGVSLHILIGKRLKSLAAR